MNVFADTFGLALCMLEILCDEQPFGGFVRSTDDQALDLKVDAESGRTANMDKVLKQCLDRFREKWAGNPMVDWLLSWLDMDVRNVQQSSSFAALAEHCSARHYDAMIEQ